MLWERLAVTMTLLEGAAEKARQISHPRPDAEPNSAPGFEKIVEFNVSVAFGVMQIDTLWETNCDDARSSSK